MATEAEVPWEELFQLAAEARRRAYAPYSKFQVGAAVLFEDGYRGAGANVENCSYGLALCAERLAIARAANDGKRRLLGLALVADADPPCTPCGMCRQVIAEFGAPDAPIRSRNLKGEERRYALRELLPHPFAPAALPGAPRVP